MKVGKSVFVDFKTFGHFEFEILHDGSPLGVGEIRIFGDFHALVFVSHLPHQGQSEGEADEDEAPREKGGDDSDKGEDFDVGNAGHCVCLV